MFVETPFSHIFYSKMTFTHYFTFLLMLTILLPAPLIAQQPLNFIRYSTKDGLPDDHVLCALLDKRNFMWFGTEYGLARFDGQQFVSFYENPKDSTSLSSVSVSALKEDEVTGKIWVGTLGGTLCLLDPFTGKIEQMRKSVKVDGINPDELSINALQLDSKYIWVGTYDHGVGRFDRQKKIYDKWIPLANDSLAHQNGFLWNTVRQIAQSTSDPNILWLAADMRGLGKLNKTTGEIQLFPIKDPSRKHLAQARAVTEDDEGIVWIATKGGGMCRFDPTNGAYVLYPFNESAWLDRNMERNKINDLTTKSDDEFWIASPESGLGLFNKKTGKYKFFNHRFSGENLERDRITQWIYLDPRDRLWVFGEKIGARLYDLRHQFFTYYHLPSGNCMAEVKTVTDFAYDTAKQRLFIATTACGCYEKPANDTFIQRARPLPSGDFQSIQTVATSPDGSVWLGGQISPSSPTTLFVLRPNERYFEPFQNPAFSKTGMLKETVNEIFTDKNGVVWVATTSEFKLYKIQPQNGKVEQVIFQDTFKPWWFVTEIEQGNNGHLLIGLRNGGVLDFDPKTNGYLRYNEPDIVYNRINSLEPDGQGGLWVSSGSMGISTLRSPPESNRNNVSIALKGDMASKLEADDSGKLWMATSHGLGVLDKNTGHVFYFSSTDGLKSDDLTNHGLEIFPGIGVFVGQPNGYVFSPKPFKALKQDTISAAITDLQILGRSVYFEKSIANTKLLVLQPHENLLTIQFAVPSYHNPLLTYFAYRLEGFEEEWQFSNKSNQATYANLEPGNYTFHLQAINPYGDKIGSETSLNIKIRPSIWQSIWFRILMGLSILGLLAGIITFYIKTRLRLKLAESEKAIETERLRTRIAQDIHDEVGSSLTKISLSAQVAARLPNLDTAELKDRLEKLGADARRTTEHLREIVFAINPDFDSFDEMQAYFRENARDFWGETPTKVHFEFEKNGLITIVPPNVKRQLLLIFKEAQNNAAKHANATNVWLSFKITKNNHYMMKVRDDGHGFMLSEGFGNTHGLNGMKKRAESINATLSIKSSPQNGTTVMVEGRL